MRPARSDIIARTTYLVSTIGDSVLTRTSSSICELCISRQHAVEADRGIVDEAVRAARIPCAASRTSSGISSILPRSNGDEMQRAAFLPRFASAIAAVNSLVVLRATAITQ